MVDGHIKKMEKFGGKNEIAQEKIEGIKKKDQEMKRQIELIDNRIAGLTNAKAKAESSVIDYQYV